MPLPISIRPRRSAGNCAGPCPTAPPISGLGRPRFVAVARWNSGRVVREAKALVPSAWDWAHEKVSREPWFVNLAKGSFRSPDPLLHIKAGFLFRRLAPDARKIDWKDVHARKLSARLLEAMGADLAAVHASDPRSTRIGADLATRGAGWLPRAAEAARQAVQRDFEAYVSRARQRP